MSWYEKLFEPLMIGKTEVKNRYFMAAMAPVCKCDENGVYSRETVEYYVRRARGGLGLIVTGANWVENESEKHKPGYFPCPTTMPGLYKKTARDMNDRIHAFDTKIFLQLTAGLGRVGSPHAIGFGDFVAPSDIKNRWTDRISCRTLTNEEIKHIISKFGEAAVIAKEAGFDGIEIHAVHEGYLLDQFAISLFNHRTDEYGGDLRGRLRMAIEIVQTIKEKCGKDYPVILRFSVKSYIKALRQGGLPGETFEEQGRDVEEALEAAKILEEAGYDCFDADAGTYDSWYWAHPPVYFGYKGMYLEHARQLKEVVSVPVIVAGRMDDPDMALKALEDGIIDGVGLGRPVLSDPDYVNKIRCGKTREIRPCLGCHDGCFGRFLFEGGVGSCAVNPECGREFIVGVRPAEEKKKIVVIGGGPAGLEASRVSAIRGHQVVLFEASDHLGGNLYVAGQPDFKEDDRQLIRWYENQLMKMNVDVRKNTIADIDMIRAENPDCIYAAEGAKPIMPAIPGIEHAVTAQQVLLGEVEAGEHIAVIGGGLVGCEIALHLAKQGKKVRIIEALGDILSSGVKLPHMNDQMLRDLLNFYDVEKYVRSQLLEIKENNDIVILNEEEQQSIPCDQVIVAIGYRPVNTMFEQLSREFPYVFKLGDSKKVRNIRSAIWDAYEVARSI